MAELLADCPRCGAVNMTLDVRASKEIKKSGAVATYESFCTCRHCGSASIFVLTHKDMATARNLQGKGPENSGHTSVNRCFAVDGFVSVKDAASVEPPAYLPESIDKVFREAATCLAVGCFNAAGTMFRLCIDLATKDHLPVDEAPGLTAKVRRDLGLRLPWLFDYAKLPGDLRELSTCIKEDGNDGAHKGTLAQPDAEDLLDFTEALLERLYTEPERIRLAAERRLARRSA